MLINAQIKNLLCSRNKHSVIFCYALVVLSTKLVCGFHSLASRGDCSVAFCHQSLGLDLDLESKPQWSGEEASESQSTSCFVQRSPFLLVREDLLKIHRTVNVAAVTVLCRNGKL